MTLALLAITVSGMLSAFFASCTVSETRVFFGASIGDPVATTVGPIGEGIKVPPVCRKADFPPRLEGCGIRELVLGSSILLDLSMPAERCIISSDLSRRILKIGNY